MKSKLITSTLTALLMERAARLNSQHGLAKIGAALVLSGVCVVAHASGIGYISSSSGYLLHMSGSTAVTADWKGQAPIQGFSGYGQIKMNERCLTGRTGNQPLTWEGCGNDAAQRWKLSGGQLNNEGGWCADVEGARGGAGVRVMAWKCSGSSNQKWRTHPVVSAQTAASRISDPNVKATFLANAAKASAGALISTRTGQMVAAGGGNLIGNDGSTMVAAGGGNMVAAGGGN
jgi:Ricin-type beta-trefoil lectin domain